jgi:hypothetical protein
MSWREIIALHYGARPAATTANTRLRAIAASAMLTESRRDIVRCRLATTASAIAIF